MLKSQLVTQICLPNETIFTSVSKLIGASYVTTKNFFFMQVSTFKKGFIHIFQIINIFKIQNAY